MTNIQVDRKPARKRTNLAIFAIPFILAGVSLAGLIIALLRDGWLDQVASIAAAAGLFAFVYALFTRR